MLPRSTFYWHNEDPVIIFRFLTSGGSTWFADQAGLSEKQQRYWLQAQRESEEQGWEVSDPADLLPAGEQIGD